MIYTRKRLETNARAAEQ